MFSFIFKSLTPDSRVVASIIAAIFISWVIWASGSITQVSASQVRLAVQQEALKENTNLKLDRMNDKLDYIIKQHEDSAKRDH